MDLYDAWSEAAAEVKKRVTGVGVWTALNKAIPITCEDGVFVLGLPQKDTELKGHLRVSGTQRAIEQAMAKKLGFDVSLELIDGITINDWQSEKRRRAEAERLQAEAITRDRRAATAAETWEELFEQISREYAALPKRALPQTRARLLERCIALCAAALKERELDEPAERNFARCLERISTYCDVPSAIVAKFVLEKAGRI